MTVVRAHHRSKGLSFGINHQGLYARYSEGRTSVQFNVGAKQSLQIKHKLDRKTGMEATFSKKGADAKLSRQLGHGFSAGVGANTASGRYAEFGYRNKKFRAPF